MKFGNKLRTLIDERDMTQKQLAKDLDIAASTVGGYVQNTSEPDFATLGRIAKYFDVSIDYLLSNPQSLAATPQEDELLRIFRSLSKEQKALYIEQGRAFIKITKNKKVMAIHEDPEV